MITRLMDLWEPESSFSLCNCICAVFVHAMLSGHSPTHCRQL